MKKIILIGGISIMILAACHPTYVVQSPETAPAPAPAPAPEISYQSFYDELSPYGRWIDYPGYGYVWMPNAGPGFKPYATNGNWVYTDMGWTWASNYSWGWAPFHYGRWFFEEGYGWMWVPGNEWAPAWVSWRTNNDYYGWAPLSPNFSVSTGYYNPPANYWCFVPHQYVTSPHMNNYYINESRNVTIINNTTVINRTTIVNNNTTVINNNTRNVYRSGPEVQEVERATGASVRPMAIRENNRPGEQVSNGQYAIYRPQVNTAAQQTNNGQTRRVAPSRVESYRDARPEANTNNTSQQSAGYQQQSANNTRPELSPREQEILNNNNRANIRPSNANSEPVNNNNNTVNRPANNTQPVNTRPSNTYTPPANSNNNNNNVNGNPGNQAQRTTSQPVNATPVNRPVNNHPVNNNNSRANTTTNNHPPQNNNANRNSTQQQQQQQVKRVNTPSNQNAGNAKPKTRPEEKKQD